MAFEVESFPGEMNWVSHLNWDLCNKSVVTMEYLWKLRIYKFKWCKNYCNSNQLNSSLILIKVILISFEHSWGMSICDKYKVYEWHPTQLTLNFYVNQLFAIFTYLMQYNYSIRAVSTTWLYLWHWINNEISKVTQYLTLVSVLPKKVTQKGDTTIKCVYHT